jgi:cell division protein FtsB
LILIGMTYLPQIQKNERMRADLDRLEAELQKQEQISKQLKAEIDALGSDPKTVERLAREKLGYAKPDETVVHFESTTK